MMKSCTSSTYVYVAMLSDMKADPTFTNGACNAFQLWSRKNCKPIKTENNAYFLHSENLLVGMIEAEDRSLPVIKQEAC